MLKIHGLLKQKKVIFIFKINEHYQELTAKLANEFSQLYRKCH